MKKTLILCILFLLCFSNIANAQLGMKKKIEEAKLIHEKPLLVVLKNSDEDNHYDFNNNFKKVVENEWTFNKEVQFVTIDELKALKKDKTTKKKFAFLMYSDFAVENNFPERSIRICLLEKAICTYYQAVNFEDNISLGELSFTLQRLQDVLNGFISYKKMNKNDYKNMQKKLSESLTSLTDKTLLFDESLISEKVKKQISAKYKYDYKIVSSEEINKAIENKSENIAYTKIVINVQPPRTKTDRNTFDGFNERGKPNKKTVVTKKGSSTSAVIVSIYDAKNGKVIYPFGLPNSKVTFKSLNGNITSKKFETFLKSLK